MVWLCTGLVVAATGSSVIHATSPTKPGEFPTCHSSCFYFLPCVKGSNEFRKRWKMSKVMEFSVQLNENSIAFCIQIFVFEIFEN